MLRNVGEFGAAAATAGTGCGIETVAAGCVDTCCTIMGAATAGVGAKATVISSSRNAVTFEPSGILALVPVVKKPATGTNAIAATTPAIPVTPLSSNWSVSLIWGQGD